MKKALIVWGGWDGHEPEQVAGVCAQLLRDADFEVEISNELVSLRITSKPDIGAGWDDYPA